jgi:hypothetical protein
MNTVMSFCIFVLCLLTFVNCQSPKTEESVIELKSEIENKPIETKQLKTESPEEKAVRLAEEFIKQNGYTNASPDKNNLSHETVEYYDNIDELLEQRHNTLASKAYGVLYRGRLGDDTGWTVVFRYSDKSIKELEKLPKSNLTSNPKLKGRAVTMNEHFENLLLEHKDFFLDKVSKRF